MNYRRMLIAAIVPFAVCTAVLGFLTAWFDLSEGQALVDFGLYLIGGLPAITYLQLIARAQRRSPKGEG